MSQAAAEKAPMMENSIVAAAPRNNGMMQTAAAQAVVQRTLGEVQVAVMMAKQFPRDKIEAKEKLVNDCCREDLALVSMYSYSRGGTEITGPSIRLAEAAKNAWGNMQSGWRELSRGNGQSEVEAFAWDSENNTRASVTFTVKHWRDTKQGGYALKEERDIYELCANQAARRERACILKMIDGDMIEAAIKQCHATLNSKIQVTPERIASMVKMFEDYGVTKEQIEKRVQRRVDTINGPLMVSLTKIYNSLRDGMSKAGDWFEAESKEPEAEGGEAPKGSKTDQVKDKLKKTKAKDAGADPDTGEIKTDAAKKTEQPEAEQEIPKLDTVDDVKQAATVLIIALEAAAMATRASLFVKMHGMAIVEAIRKHGQGVLIGKIKNLGIALPE